MMLWSFDGMLGMSWAEGSGNLRACGGNKSTAAADCANGGDEDSAGSPMNRRGECGDLEETDSLDMRGEIDENWVRTSTLEAASQPQGNIVEDTASVALDDRP
jgi:hypothetical protein